MSIFGTIYQDEELPARARMVYMYLRDRAGRAGSCWPAINTIAADLHLSRSTVKRALKDLDRAGKLEKQHRQRPNGSQTSNLYTVEKREDREEFIILKKE